MNKTQLLNRLARDEEERMLLARVLDKLEQARSRSIPARMRSAAPGKPSGPKHSLAVRLDRHSSSATLPAGRSTADRFSGHSTVAKPLPARMARCFSTRRRLSSSHTCMVAR